VIKNKKQMYVVISVFALVLMLGTVTYAFFNYTRIGTANSIHTGNISFTSSQSGIFNLTNVFPIEREGAPLDEDNSDEIVITISGDTSYTSGIEYLVTLEDVSISTSTNKKIPIGLIVTPETTGELGTSNNNYFNNNVRGGNASVYKVLNGSAAGDMVKEGEYVLVGYIAPGQSEVNGTIGIRVFIDKAKIAISDTYDEFGGVSDNYGTTGSWVGDREVFTTSEWNSLGGNNEISFKVRVQANEGIWVGEPLSRNDIVNINDNGVFTPEQKSSITEIKVIKMSEEMINTHRDAIDLSAENGQGVVKGWVEDIGNNGKILYIASPGEVYLPEDSSYFFAGGYNKFNHLAIIDLNNINTSQVENMEGMFQSSGIGYIDVSGFDTSNVENMNWMFQSCPNLTSIDISKFDTTNVTTMRNLFSYSSNLESINVQGLGNDTLAYIDGMFSGCTNLTEINMSSFDFGSTSMSNLFYNLRNLERVNLKNADTSDVTSMYELFRDCVSIEAIDLSNMGGNSLSSTSQMFSGCSSLKNVNMSGFNFGNTTDISNLFYILTSLETVNLSNADLSNVENVNYMFYSSNNLTSVNFTDVTTGSIAYATSMFQGCTSLKTIDMDIFDFGTASMDNLFLNCTSLEQADLSRIDTSNVSSMNYAFKGCSNLKYVNLSNGGNSNIYMNQIFDQCLNLKEINMSGFTFGENINYLFMSLSSLETINLTNVDTSNVKYMGQLFKGCTNLTTLDLSSFDTSNVTYMGEMFAMESFDTSTYTWSPSNNKLITIKVGSNWNVDGVTVDNSYHMFSNCIHLIGGSGTIFDSNYIDKTRAIIDGGQNNPGYLTLSNN